MKLSAVWLCLFLAGIQSSQGRTFPAPPPASHTPNGVMFPGRQYGNERSKTDSNILPAKPRIMNGTVAEKHEFPWMVQLHIDSSEILGKPSLRTPTYIYYCCSFVIDEWWLITAAHCVHSNKAADFKIVAGDHQLSVIEAEEQHRKIETIVLHPEWNKIDGSNDIALLKLSEKLKLDGKTVAPISLPTPLLNSAGECVVAGWGSRGPLDDVSDFLMKVTAPILSDEECSKIFEKVNITIVDSMICAGDKTGGKGPFLADSGSSLVCQGDNNEPYVAGVVSFGKDPLRYPTAYTEVSYFVDWINKVRNQE